MEIKKIQYSFAGIWKTSPPLVYMADKTYTRSLFGDAINTSDGIGPQGEQTIIKDDGGKQTHIVIINQQRLQITTPTIEDLPDLVLSLIGKLSEINGGMGLEFSRFWLTVELEVLNVVESGNNTSRWIATRFLDGNLEMGDDFAEDSLMTRQMIFNIKGKDGTVFLIDVQPRANNATALYFRISEEVSGLVFDLSNKDAALKQLQIKEANIFNRSLKLFGL